MAIKINGSVLSRVSTVNFERQLLHMLLDKMNLQRTLGKHSQDFFTNFSRQFIYDCINSTFSDKRAVLTRDKLEFEIQKKFDPAKNKDTIEDILSEYELVLKTIPTGDIDGVIAYLDNVLLGNHAELLILEAYGMLEKGDYAGAAKILMQKSVDLQEKHDEGAVLSLHDDTADLFEEIENRKVHPEEYAGILTGFEKFDKMTGGLFPAELTVIFGLSGKGKSTFMKALACNMRKNGKVILHCGNEENLFQMRLKYMCADSGLKYSPLKRGTYDDEEFNRMKVFSENARSTGKIYVYEFPQQTDATWIERAYRSLEMRGIHVDAIFVDYLDLMKPISTAYSENDEQGKITSDLKQLAINCHCPVVTATQAGTQSEKQEKKAKPFLTAADVFGTKRKVHSANTLIGIVNQTATAMANDLDVKDRRIHHMVLCVPKNRDGAVFTFRLKLDTECGQFYDEDDKDIEEAVLNSIEKQTMLMIDESNSSMISEIDQNEIENAVSAAYQKRIDKLSESLNEEESDGKADEMFLSVDEASSSSESEKVDDETNDGQESEEEPFLIEDTPPQEESVENDEPADAEGKFVDDLKFDADEVHWDTKKWNAVSSDDDNVSEAEEKAEEPEEKKVITAPIAPPPPIENPPTASKADAIRHTMSLQEILSRRK